MAQNRLQPVLMAIVPFLLPILAAFLTNTPGGFSSDPDYADMFTLPDGSGFAVTGEREPGGGTSRTVGFLVAECAKPLLRYPLPPNDRFAA